MKRNFAGLMDEIRAAIRKMKLGKATGPGSLSVEFLEALEDYGIDEVTTLYPISILKKSEYKLWALHTNFTLWLSILGRNRSKSAGIKLIESKKY